MPLYEYYCRDCKSTFELLRPIRDAAAKAACPRGHAGAARTVSLVAGRSWGGAAPGVAGGGCACGGGACGCGH